MTAWAFLSDKLDKIFEAYVTTKEKGTGLGLAIVKHNVELYGGSGAAGTVSKKARDLSYYSRRKPL